MGRQPSIDDGWLICKSTFIRSFQSQNIIQLFPLASMKKKFHRLVYSGFIIIDNQQHRVPLAMRNSEIYNSSQSLYWSSAMVLQSPLWYFHRLVEVMRYYNVFSVNGKSLECGIYDALAKRISFQSRNAGNYAAGINQRVANGIFSSKFAHPIR